MRRSALAAIGALSVVLLPATPALAAPSPTPGAMTAAVPGQKVCSISSTALSGLTGLATNGTGYAVVSGAAQQVYLLGGNCKQTGSVKYPAQANSVQDLQVSADGTYWAADIGNTGGDRTSVAVWKLPKTGKKLIYRFKYPAGAQYDALAMVMSGNGTPVFITKVTTGPAGVYVPAAALNAAGNPVALKKVGTFTPQHTGTSNPFGPVGAATVTGGTTSPDGTKVALRTYADAYEWDVTGGDVAAAIVGGKPRVTPLPDEAAGEAIAYSRDGASFLTVSKMEVNGDHTDPLLKYKPSQGTSVANAPAGGGATPAADTRNWWDKLSLEQITYLVAAVGVIGLLMVAGGIVGIRRARKRQKTAVRATKASAVRPEPEDWVDPAAQAPDYDPYAYQDAQYGHGGAAGSYRGGTYQGGGGYGEDSYRDDRYRDDGRRDDGRRDDGRRDSDYGNAGYGGGGYGGGGYGNVGYGGAGYRDDGYRDDRYSAPEPARTSWPESGRGRSAPPPDRRGYPDDHGGYGRR